LDAVETIRSFNAGRDPQRLAMKYANLRRSPFVFLRGTCHLYYDRLPAGRLYSKAPLVWVCGDLHLENFGSFKGDNRLVYFDINDFDESALAPASWDLVRFLTSVLLGANDLNAGDADARRLCESFVEAYATALASGSARWLERDTAQGLVKHALESLKDRSREEHLDHRTERHRGKRVLRCDDKRAMAATDAERSRVTKLIGAFAAEQAKPSFFEVLDVAHRIAGTGSLGLERYVVLVEGKGSPNGNYLLDLKQTLPSSLERHLKVKQPAWVSQAHRVVAVQQRVQAAPMAFLHPIARRRTSYVLRGLQPSEDRVALDAPDVGLDQIREVIQDMGRLVAWAQLRSVGRQGSAIADELIAFGASRKKWRSDLVLAARGCAKQVRKDWAAYCAAYDAGAFPAHG
jgi:uncharacterized protein (DUF2252 family)